jgi:hypothetical protein
LVTVRLERQSLLTKPRAPHLSVVLNEAVLRRPVGGPAVMAAQLHRVLEMTQRASVSVRIVPFNAGAHGGAAGSPFCILDFAIDHRTRKPIEPRTAYVERALSETDSAKLITQAMEGYSRE